MSLKFNHLGVVPVGNKVDDGDAFAAALEVVVACARVCQHHHPEERHDGGDEAGLTRWRR